MKPQPIIAKPMPRAFLADLNAYVPGEQPDDARTIKLNTNEFPYPAEPGVLEAIRGEAADTVRVYPNPTCAPLREALARHHGVSPEQIIVGNGSDEILRLIVHGWLGEGRVMGIVAPTYSLFEVLATQFETHFVRFALAGGERLPIAVRREPWDALLLPVPNPPLGTVFPEEELRAVLDTGRLVVLDGAYIEFAEGHEPIGWLGDYPNLIVTRTFSKSFGLAGLRVGYGVASAEIIAGLHKLRDSYNVNRISQAAALGALAASDYYAGRCAEIVDSRRQLTAQLENRGFRVHPSQGNFVFARRREAPRLYEALKAGGILVRYFNRIGLDDGLRITIGTPEQNQVLLDALDRILAEL